MAPIDLNDSHVFITSVLVPCYEKGRSHETCHFLCSNHLGSFSCDFSTPLFM